MDAGTLVQPLGNVKEKKSMAKDQPTIEAAAAQVAQANARRDALEGELAETKKDRDKWHGEAESLRTRLDTLEKERQDDDPEQLKATIATLTAKVQESEKRRLDAEAPARLRD